MVRPLEAHIEIAKRLLAQECGSGGDAEEQAAAADSFRAVMRSTLATSTGELQVQGFVQRLAIHLTSCAATTFRERRNRSTDSRPGVR